MDAAILSGFRRVAPLGLDGGAPGSVGRNIVRRSNGGEETLPGSTQLSVDAGDVLVVETPTGGGFGAPTT